MHSLRIGQVVSWNSGGYRHFGVIDNFPSLGKAEIEYTHSKPPSHHTPGCMVHLSTSILRTV